MSVCSVWSVVCVVCGVWCVGVGVDVGIGMGTGTGMGIGVWEGVRVLV